MLRSALTAAVAVLLTATLLWGGCASCDQLFARVKADSGCCESSGKCKTPTPNPDSHKHCKSPTLALQQYVKASDHTGDAATSGEAPPPANGAIVVIAAKVSAPVSAVPGYSPPDLYRLHSAFLI